ncbi:MAG TPA: T9SS type A sorting domain-containing protein, partial [Saprospiraceae bacterium]|nr:T9SS type A sorting domain-containing protein [Saprospiraceae bacterium]
FPIPNAGVTVFFDATQGAGGLANCNCDIYVHTGLITSASTSGSDWKHVVTDWGVANANWKMTPVAGQNDVFSFTIAPNISTYYGVSGGESIQKLAFVFRNADGSKVGKGDGDTDLFYDVFSSGFPFTVLVQSPTESSLVKAVGDTIPYKADVSELATLSLYDNGSLLTEVTNIQSINYDIIAQAGAHHIELKADNGNQIITKSFNYIVPGTPTIEALPAGMEHGINYLNDSSVLLALYAPNKDFVFVIGDFNNWELNDNYLMNQTPDHKVWWLTINGFTPNETVGFQYNVDGNILIGDPYCETVLDPQNDQYIPSSTYPNMPPYPSGKTTGIVSLMTPGEAPFDWQVTDFQKPEKTNLVIYELLLRDFLGQPNFNTLKDTLDYLSNLGVNAIELMPINEFDGNISWGYNPVYHGAIDKYYGTKEAFKALVDACHERGIAVILDVVFNHAHENSPLAKLYWDSANFKPSADNPWLNQVAPHNYSVFYDFNHESPATKLFVDEILTHWLENYHVDGFRFDLTKGFTQNVGGNYDAWAYDASRIAILKHYANTIWNTSSDAYVILEHFTENSEEKELANYGMMLWSGFGVHDNYLEASMGYDSDITDISYAKRTWSEPHLVGYMESHDEERMAYKNHKYGNSSGSYSVKNQATSMKRIELASAFFYTIPGPKMLWEFGELGYDYSINYCQNGSVNPSCRVDPKPIKWDYLQDADRHHLYETVSNIIYLRTHYPLFKTTTFSISQTGKTKSIRLSDTDSKGIVVGNFDVVQKSATPIFYHTGIWYDYLSGDSIQVDNIMMPIDLAPGEYHIYLDKKVATPNATTTPKKLIYTELHPNPSDGRFTLRYQTHSVKDVLIQVISPSGKIVISEQQKKMASGIHEWSPSQNLSSGFYWVRLATKDGIGVEKVLIEMH